MGKHSKGEYLPYDLNAVDDIEAWGAHEIRSHRRASEHSLRRALVVFGVIALAAGALNASVAPDERPTRTSILTAPEFPLSPQQTAGVPQETPPISEPDREPQAEASRSQAQRTAPPTPSKIEQVIAYALAQQGDRYSFGAAGPNSFDCSGLIMAAFKTVGINLPHYTGSMIGYGARISRGAMVRGDIVFLASNHVGLYLGGGMMVAASSGQGKVTVQKVYAFYAARRLL